jgi:hypothetical protein
MGWCFRRTLKILPKREQLFAKQRPSFQRLVVDSEEAGP